MQAALGRGKGSHARQSIDIFELAHAYGIRTKLNTIVTALSWEDDMSAFVRRVQPARWKIFQVLPVGGQNDGLVEPLLITSDQFRAFVERHAPVRAEGWPGHGGQRRDDELVRHRGPARALLRSRPILYSGPLSMFGAKVEIAAVEKRLDVKVVMVPYESHAGYSPKHPEVVRINPKQQVPVLVHGDLDIFDSTQIFEYLEDLAPEPALWPRNVRDCARARRLELESDEVYFPHVIRLMGLQDQLDGEPARAAIAAATCRYRTSSTAIEA